MGSTSNSAAPLKAALERMNYTGPVVLHGSWLYGGKLPREVRIVQHDTLYGSGDAADTAEIAEDREVECYYVEYQTSVGQPQWVGGGGYLSITEAKQAVEKLLGKSLTWCAL